MAGVVVAAGSARPLGGAQVGIASQPGRGAITDASGSFRLTGIIGTTVALHVRLIGYRPRTDTVRVGDAPVRLALETAALELDRIVVTGTPGATANRELGTSVATIDVADVIARSPVPTVDGLLNGRAPGVDIIGTSGQVGGGAAIRVRGIGTFSLSSVPLVYVDGIRTDNGQSRSNISSLISRFDDFATEEIERIEVLKGPAAATLYGTEAARGVINIITRRGSAGATAYTFTGQAGTQWFQNAAGRFPTNYWINPATNAVMSINMVQSEAARGTPLFHHGGIAGYSASASGGTGAYRYFVSGEAGKSDGIVPTNGQLRRTFRTNLSLVPSSAVSLDASVGYVANHTNVAFEGASAGPMWGEFAQPQRTAAACAPNAARGCGWSRGFPTTPPEVTNATQRWEDVRRTTASLSLKYDPYPWLSHRLLVGTDYSTQDINSYLPYQADSVMVFFLGSGFDGSRTENVTQVTFNTYDYAGTAQFDLQSGLTTKTSLGVQYYTMAASTLTATGTKFPFPGLSSISSTGTKGTPTSSTTVNKTLGAYVQQQFALNNRLFVTGALRVDNNSAFGSDVNFTTYPKLGVSWVASDEPGVRRFLPSAVDALRLRAAYGASGQQPATNSALRTLTTAAGPSGTSTLTAGSVGNAALKPERVIGLEFGFETGLWHDRVGIDLTLFSDVSRDAILTTRAAPSTGFGASTQFRNVGRIDKHGIEVALKGDVINRRDYGWSMQLNIAGATARIVSLAPGDTLLQVSNTTAVSTVQDIYHRLGYAPFDLFTYHVVAATYDPATRKATNLVCDDAQGGTLPCYAPGTSTLQAPLVYYGHSIPTTTGSWVNTLRHGRFRLYAMVDFQAGHRKTDTVFEQNCQLFFVCPIVVFPDRYAPNVVASAQDGTGRIQDHFIRSAAFSKLREVALSYDAPAAFASTLRAKSLGLTVAARNLAMLTRYTGIDPENSVGGGNVNFGTDQTEYPQLASVTLTLRLGY